MIQSLLVFLVIAVPVYIFYRMKVGGASSIFNFLLYPLVFGYFYLLVPSLIPFVTTLEQSLSLSADSFEVVDILSVWSVAVFLVVYGMTIDKKVSFNVTLRLASFSRSVSRFIQILCLFISVFILLRHGAALYALAGDRAQSYEYYSREVVEVYRLPLIFSFAAVSSTILFLHYRTVLNLIPLFPFAIIDALQGGRGSTFAAIVFFGLNYIAVHMDRFKKVAILMLTIVVALFASAYLRRFVAVDETGDPLVAFFGEFFFTRLTAQYAYDNLMGAGDVGTYFLVSVSKLLPQFLVSSAFSEADLVPYHLVLNDRLGAGFGLAGSIVSEALYHGGVPFAVFSPVLIAAVLFHFQRSCVHFRLPGYLFFAFVSSSMFVIFRTGFYTNFFSLIYMFLYYFSFFLLPSVKAKVLIVRA